MESGFGDERDWGGVGMMVDACMRAARREAGRATGGWRVFVGICIVGILGCCTVSG
ncbi:uncharacterized protein An07g05540 [Aspergillus niger]|uniref:Contig An07c0150, genomic contig n=2 Tax=Aspergillus niger TaxID=5061 RepID=A2QNG4_ASPNC|nr:uncharacterized protein An07g05540 [Aspergillus niger]CAK39470.1 unnamed protein product [Aspergillus niger]